MRDTVRLSIYIRVKGELYDGILPLHKELEIFFNINNDFLKKRE